MFVGNAKRSCKTVKTGSRLLWVKTLATELLAVLLSWLLKITDNFYLNEIFIERNGVSAITFVELFSHLTKWRRENESFTCIV